MSLKLISSVFSMPLQEPSILREVVVFTATGLVIAQLVDKLSNAFFKQLPPEQRRGFYQWIWWGLGMAALAKVPDKMVALACFAIFNSLVYFRLKPQKGDCQIEPPPFFLHDLGKEVKESASLIVENEEGIKALETQFLTSTQGAILVGKPRSGKTALVEALAWKAKQGKFPETSPFHGKKFYRLDKAEFENHNIERLATCLSDLVQFTKRNKGAIIFIKDIHMLGRPSLLGGSILDQLKESVSKGDIRVIGTTTKELYHWYFNPRKERRVDDALVNPSYVSLLPKIVIEEPGGEDCFRILKHRMDHPSFQERYPHIRLSDEKLQRIIQITRQRDLNIGQPSKAIQEMERRAAKKFYQSYRLFLPYLQKAQGNVEIATQDFKQSMQRYKLGKGLVTEEEAWKNRLRNLGLDSKQAEEAWKRHLYSDLRSIASIV